MLALALPFSFSCLFDSDSHLLTLCRCWFIWITVINIIVSHFFYLYHLHIHTQYIGILVEFGSSTILFLFSVWSEMSFPVYLSVCLLAHSHGHMLSPIHASFSLASFEHSTQHPKAKTQQRRRRRRSSSGGGGGGGGDCCCYITNIKEKSGRYLFK